MLSLASSVYNDNSKYWCAYTFEGSEAEVVQFIAGIKFASFWTQTLRQKRGRLEIE